MSRSEEWIIQEKFCFVFVMMNHILFSGLSFYLEGRLVKGLSHKQGSQFRTPVAGPSYLISSPHVEIRNLTKYVIEMNSVSLRVATGLVHDISSLI